MGYFDALAEAAFKPKDEKTVIFLPYGVITKGYILSYDESLRVKKLLRDFDASSFFLTVMGVIALRAYALILLVVLVPWYVIMVQRITKGKPRSPEASRLTDVAKTMALAMGARTCFLLMMAAGLMFAASLIVLMRTAHKAVGWIGVVFFGAGLVHALWLLSLSLKDKH